jgi:hypothetical protein
MSAPMMDPITRLVTSKLLSFLLELEPLGGPETFRPADTMFI